jgi:enhancer of yellow 2 transcription factor
MPFAPESTIIHLHASYMRPRSTRSAALSYIWSSALAHTLFASRHRAPRLKEMLRAKLVESGWRDSLKEHCKELIRSKGKEKVTVDELAAEITPHGRGARRKPSRQATMRRVHQMRSCTHPARIPALTLPYLQPPFHRM